MTATTAERAERQPGPAGGGGSQEQPYERRWFALGVVLVAAFMVLLDISIVNVAIPSIQRNLNASFGQIQLVLALYQLAYAVVLITGGRLGDIFGRKRLFMLGMTGFVLASALCGTAQTANILIASRVLQGVMAALMYPQVLSVIQVNFPQRERATAFAIFGATIGIATITGPLAGGLLIQGNLFGLDWRPIFLVNLPIGIAALIAAYFLLHESKAPHATSLDLSGVAIVTLGLFLLVFPLVEGRDAGWPWWSYVCLVASVPVLVAFVLFERRLTARQASPLVDLHLFRDRPFDAGLGISLLFFAGIPAFFLTLSLTLQIGLGYSPLHAGLTTLPFSVGSFLASAASARLAPKLGRVMLFIGLGLLVVGTALVILTVYLGGTGIASLAFAPAFFVSGLGLGTVVAPLVNIVLSGVNPRNAGAASGVLTTVQQVGGAIGVALIGVLFFGLLGHHANTVTAQLNPGIRTQLAAKHIPPAQIGGIATGFDTCFHDRSNASDPSATPPSCRSTQAKGSVGGVLAAAGALALKRDFLYSFNASLLFNIALWSVTFLLVFLLPASTKRTLQGGSPGGH